MMRPAPGPFTRVDFPACARTQHARRTASPASEGVGERRALGDAMADALTDVRLSNLAYTVQNWHSTASFDRQEALAAHLRTQMGPDAFTTEEVLALAEEVQAHRASPKARDTVHFDVQVDTSTAQAALSSLEERARSLTATLDSVLERMTRVQAADVVIEPRVETTGMDPAALAERVVAAMMTVLPQALDRVVREHRHAEPPRVSGPGMKQEMLSDVAAPAREAMLTTELEQTRRELDLATRYRAVFASAHGPAVPVPFHVAAAVVPWLEEVLTPGAASRATFPGQGLMDLLACLRFEPAQPKASATTSADDLPAIDAMLTSVGVPAMVPGPNGGMSNVTRDRVAALMDAHNHLKQQRQQPAVSTEQAPSSTGARLGIVVPLDVIRPVWQWLMGVGLDERLDTPFPGREELRAFVDALRPKAAVPLKREGANEMVANATLERLRHEVNRLGDWGSDPIRGKAEIVRLAEQLHALALARPPDRLAKLEAVANAARDTHVGVAGGQQRLADALRELDGVR